MYLVIEPDRLLEYGFKEYKSGFSKKLPFGFLDVTFSDLILKKVHYNDGRFIYEDETGENIKELIEESIVKLINEKKT